MADPRLAVGVDRLHAQMLSAKYDNVCITYDEDEENGSAQVGLAVMLDADGGQISLAADGEFVLGELLAVESDGICLVQYHGFMVLPAGTQASLTRGKHIVGAVLVAAEGYIREVATGVAAELGVCRGFIYDASVTTAVEVYL